MSIFFISLTAFVASVLTLFSGFGLGTLLMPIVAIFLPVPVAVAITALVHGLNSFLKLGLLWREAAWRIVLVFGLPALIAAILGALLLNYLSHLPVIMIYDLGGIIATITPVKLAAGVLLIVFASAEMFPFLNRLSASSSLAMVSGGVLSGFFGGLSGHQGAFRSAFLIKAGLDKNAFVATNAAIAALVDTARLIVYALTFDIALIAPHVSLILAACLAACAGVFLGTMMLKKITLNVIQKLVAVMLYALGMLLIVGLI
jgi:uncharacterized membrane protein YfcA